MATGRFIRLRKVEVHNLKRIDLDIPHGQLVVLCGVSGSGKSSLAFDTLYAEGQRRYIESFSAYTRQFLERLEKPAAELIDGIPPSIAVASKSPSRTNRSTVGTATETHDYLRLLFAKIGQVYCTNCGQRVVRSSPQSVAQHITTLPQETRLMLGFWLVVPVGQNHQDLAAQLREEGYVRVVAAGHLLNLSEQPLPDSIPDQRLLVIVDRLTAGGQSSQRLRDSLETAFARGSGQVQLLMETAAADTILPEQQFPIDGRVWHRQAFSNRLRCDQCRIEYPLPEPRLFSFNSPLGACPRCEGFGNVLDIDWDLVIPDQEKTLRQGAVAPWNTPAYEHELKELLALAGDYDIPVDVPYRELDERQRKLVIEGVAERKFGGLNGFFAWLEKRKYKTPMRVYLSRWRSARICPDCHGARLQPAALAVRVGGKNLAEINALEVRQAAACFDQLELDDHDRTVGRMMLEQVRARLGYLQTVGLGYLTLDRPLKTLSGGEAHRVGLTSALGSSLVNMLYVLDEPSVGLHPQDSARLLGAITGLRDRNNSVVVVEHEESIIRAADQVIEIGPGAGDRGGTVTFQGTPAELEQTAGSVTGDYLAGRRLIRGSDRPRAASHGWLRLVGTSGNNLQNLTVEFPLGLLCVITGVSGAGKSTLVQDTLYPALCQRLNKTADRPAPFEDLLGHGQLEDVLLIDQTPIGRSPRSNPVTYLKIFDEIRNVFSETLEARTHNYTAGHFSFNVDGGRCNVCQGEGYLEVDMQFLADVYMKCSQCHGARYRREILAVTYRGQSIADVLDMTVREAFGFFRGQAKVQGKLKKLMDVGLDYLRLGQPANTLSGGESQRLKLAAFMSAARRGRCLFIMDEPTTGLHFHDVVQLLDCFEALVALGHSLIVVEHHLQLIKAADYVIDLGPGAAREGGQVVAAGTPESVSQVKASITGRFLAETLARDAAAAAQFAQETE